MTGHHLADQRPRVVLLVDEAARRVGDRMVIVADLEHSSSFDRQPDALLGQARLADLRLPHGRGQLLGNLRERVDHTTLAGHDPRGGTVATVCASTPK